MPRNTVSTSYKPPPNHATTYRALSRTGTQSQGHANRNPAMTTPPAGELWCNGSIAASRHATSSQQSLQSLFLIPCESNRRKQPSLFCCLVTFLRIEERETRKPRLNDDHSLAEGGRVTFVRPVPYVVGPALANCPLRFRIA